MHSAKEPYRLGSWRVFPDRHEFLEDKGAVRRVQPLLVGLLQRLIEADGRTVRRDELLSSVWQRRHVNDEVLSRAIADLRRALDDDARHPWLIETVPKLGYRLRVAAQPLPTPSVEAHSVDQAEIASTSRWGRALTASVLVLLASALAWHLAVAPSPRIDRPDVGDMVYARPLVSDPGWSLTPRFSRTGDLIAYSAANPETNVARIHVRSRDGRIASAIENQGQWDICPLFSHDGLELYWTRHHTDGCQLMQVALAGGSPLMLAACAEGIRSCPDIDPDGKTIVFTAALDEPTAGVGLAALRLRDGQLTRLVDPASGPLNDADPRYSPDGRQLAFLRGQSSLRSVILSDTDGRSAQTLSLGDARIYGVAWLDQWHLLAATDSEGTRALIRLDVRDGSRRLLGAPGARYPDRAKDGALVWEVAHYQTNLWLVSDEGIERQLTHHRRSDGAQSISPDGRRLAFQSNREGFDGIWVLDLDSGVEQRLPFSTADIWTDPAWSPDGQTLLMTRYGQGVSEVWSYRHGSTAPQRVPGVPDHGHAAQFDPDGVNIWYFISGPGGERRLWRTSSVGDGSAVVPLPWPIDSFRSHRRGLFVNRSHGAGIWRCELDGSACTEVPAASASRVGSTGNWTLTDTMLYRSITDDTATVTWRTPLEGGISTRTAWPPSTSPKSLAVLPDDSSAVITRGTLNHLELAWLPPASERGEPTTDPPGKVY